MNRVNAMLMPSIAFEGPRLPFLDPEREIQSSDSTKNLPRNSEESLKTYFEYKLKLLGAGDVVAVLSGINSKC